MLIDVALQTRRRRGHRQPRSISFKDKLKRAVKIRRRNSTVLKTVKDIFRSDGLGGFYRGIYVAKVKSPLATAITFTLYNFFVTFPPLVPYKDHY